VKIQKAKATVPVLRELKAGEGRPTEQMTHYGMNTRARKEDTVYLLHKQ
jgi:hypothetical protein